MITVYARYFLLFDPWDAAAKIILQHPVYPLTPTDAIRVIDKIERSYVPVESAMPWLSHELN